MLAAVVLASWVVPMAGSPAGAQPATWNFAQANVFAAQGAGRDGSGVTVAVVDTWVDFSHPDFGGRVVDEAYCVGRNGSCLDHHYAPDSCVHGTHVSGTVASADYGVAPAARILAVQVLAYDPSSGECSGSTNDVAAGIHWATAHGAQVINLSLGDLVPGLFQSTAVTDAVHAAAAAGVVVVIAAGNESLPLTDDYGTDALLVAATGPSGQLATYSDRNGSVSLAAPGGDDGANGLNACTPSNCILSTEPHNRYGLLEGTSMAAPHVSGAAALLLAQNPHRGRANVLQALEATARPLAGAGHGLLNAGAALSVRPPTTTPAPASPPAGPTTGAAPASSGAGHPAGGPQGQPADVAPPPPSSSTTVRAAPRPAAPRLATSRPAAGALAPAARAPAATSGHHPSGLWWLGVVAAALILAAAGGIARRIINFNRASRATSWQQTEG